MINKENKYPTWVIQSNKIKTSQTLGLVNALTKLSEPFVDICLDHGEAVTPLSDELGKNLIPYGSVQLVKLAEKEGWQHLFFNEKTFNAKAWSDSDQRMLNEDCYIAPLSKIKNVLHQRREWFIRPEEDLKTFHGHVSSSLELRSWIERLEKSDCEIDGSCRAVLSSVKDIQMEWRYFIVGGKIVTGSSYRFKGQPHRKRETDKDVLAEAQELADIWLPHETCVMDTALWNDRLYVVEFNGLNASGFYDHDVEAFAKAVSEYVKGHSL